MFYHWTVSIDLLYLAMDGIVAVFSEVDTSSAAFLVHWMNSCDSLLSYLFYVYGDSVSYLKKLINIPLFKKNWAYYY